MIQDSIEIHGLQASTHIGVPDAERAAVQNVKFDLLLVPKQGFEEMADEIGETVDYAAVTERVREISAARPRQLIEVLAADVAEALLVEYPIAVVEIKVRKFILPEVEYVAVHLLRESRAQSTKGAQS